MAGAVFFCASTHHLEVSVDRIAVLTPFQRYLGTQQQRFVLPEDTKDVRALQVRTINKMVDSWLPTKDILTLLESFPKDRLFSTEVVSNSRHPALARIIRNMQEMGLVPTGTPRLDYFSISIHQALFQMHGRELDRDEVARLRKLLKDYTDLQHGGPSLDRSIDPQMQGIIYKNILDMAEDLSPGISRPYRLIGRFSLWQRLRGTAHLIAEDEVRDAVRDLFVRGIHPGAQLRILVGFARREVVTRAEAFFILERIPLSSRNYYHYGSQNHVFPERFREYTPMKIAAGDRAVEIPISLVLLEEVLADIDIGSAGRISQFRMRHLVRSILSSELATMAESTPEPVRQALEAFILDVESLRNRP